jgi:hypothetical protein
MKLSPFKNTPQIYFWSICGVILAWATATLYMEIHLGFPMTRLDWGHRLIGWFINFILIQKFVAGTKRYYSRIEQKI